MQRPLWPYQQSALSACLNILGVKPGYVQMPTGSGKSEVIKRIVEAWLKTHKHKAIIAVPNRTLALQHRANFIMYSHEYPTLCLEGYPVCRSSRLVISTYTSFNRIPGYYKYFPRKDTLVIADECHHCNHQAYQNLTLIFLYKNRIGFSGTPWSEGCSSCFSENLVYGVSLKEAQQAGMLCNYIIEKRERLEPIPFQKWQRIHLAFEIRF